MPTTARPRCILAIAALVVLCTTAEQHTDELLVMATAQNDADAVRDLIEAGVSPDTIVEKGMTVLIMASAMGHTSVVQSLLQASSPPPPWRG